MALKDLYVSEVLHTMYLVNHTHREVVLLPANAEYKLFEVVSHALKTFPKWELSDDVEMYKREEGANDSGYDYIWNIITSHSYEICEY